MKLDLNAILSDMPWIATADPEVYWSEDDESAIEDYEASIPSQLRCGELWVQPEHGVAAAFDNSTPNFVFPEDERIGPAPALAETLKAVAYIDAVGKIRTAILTNFKTGAVLAKFENVTDENIEDVKSQIIAASLALGQGEPKIAVI